MGVGDQRHAPATLPPGKGPGTYCIGGCVSHRARLDGCSTLRLHRRSKQGPSSPQRVATPTEL